MARKEEIERELERLKSQQRQQVADESRQVFTVLRSSGTNVSGSGKRSSSGGRQSNKSEMLNASAFKMQQQDR